MNLIPCKVSVVKNLGVEQNAIFRHDPNEASCVISKVRRDVDPDRKYGQDTILIVSPETMQLVKATRVWRTK